MKRKKVEEEKRGKKEGKEGMEKKIAQTWIHTLDDPLFPTRVATFEEKKSLLFLHDLTTHVQKNSFKLVQNCGRS